MKNFLFSLALLALPLAAAQAQTKSTKVAQLQIHTSAVCGMCKTTLEKAMAYEKGVQAAELDVPSKMLTVVYRPDKTSPEQLRRAVVQSGYNADSLAADPRAFSRLAECCQSDTEAAHECQDH